MKVKGVKQNARKNMICNELAHQTKYMVFVLQSGLAVNQARIRKDQQDLNFLATKKRDSKKIRTFKRTTEQNRTTQHQISKSTSTDQKTRSK